MSELSILKRRASGYKGQNGRKLRAESPDVAHLNLPGVVLTVRLPFLAVE